MSTIWLIKLKKPAFGKNAGDTMRAYPDSLKSAGLKAGDDFEQRGTYPGPAKCEVEAYLNQLADAEVPAGTPAPTPAPKPGEVTDREIKSPTVN